MDFLDTNAAQRLRDAEPNQLLVWGVCTDPGIVREAIRKSGEGTQNPAFPWRSLRRSDGALRLLTAHRMGNRNQVMLLESLYLDFVRYRKRGAYAVAMLRQDSMDLCCSGWPSDTTIPTGWPQHRLPGDPNILNGFGHTPFVVGSSAHARLDDIASLATAIKGAA